jgi:L-ascorbate metabolism protein UlaG (beta-lactamase superfamily)
LHLTWVNHSCFRVENDGFVMVLDPGVLVPATVLNDADAVLISHEHGDHFEPSTIVARVATRPHLPVYTNKSVGALLAGSGADVHVVGHGDAFMLGGVRVQVHGEWHAPIAPDIPRVRNVGFQFGSKFYHPGDAYTDPHQHVGVMTVPEFGTFTTLGESMQFVQQVKPGLAIPCHDTGLDLIGIQGADGPACRSALGRATDGRAAPRPVGPVRRPSATPAGSAGSGRTAARDRPRRTSGPTPRDRRRRTPDALASSVRARRNSAPVRDPGT